MLNYLYLYRFEIYFEGNATYFISFLYAFEISLAIPSLTLEEAIDKSKLNWWNEWNLHFSIGVWELVWAQYFISDKYFL